MLHSLECGYTNVNQHCHLKLFRLLEVTDTVTDSKLWEVALMRFRGFLKQHSQIYIQTSACICIIGGCSGHVQCIKHGSGEKMILIIRGHQFSCSASFILLAACLQIIYLMVLWGVLFLLFFCFLQKQNKDYTSLELGCLQFSQKIYLSVQEHFQKTTAFGS